MKLRDDAISIVWSDILNKVITSAGIPLCFVSVAPLHRRDFWARPIILSYDFLRVLSMILIWHVGG